MSTHQTSPRLYHAPISTWWWLSKRSYTAFVLRESSSVFVAWFVVYLLLLAAAVGGGAAAYDRFLEWSAGPAVVAVNVVALLFVILHAVTFFWLAPQASPVRVRGRRIPDVILAGTLYLGWAIVSAFVLWLVVLA